MLSFDTLFFEKKIKTQNKTNAIDTTAFPKKRELTNIINEKVLSFTR